MLAHAFLKSLRLLVPGILTLIAGILLQQQAAALPLHYKDIVTLLPYVLGVISLILAMSFNQGRLFLGTLNALCFYAAIQTELQTSLNLPANFVFFSLLCLLFPAQQALLSLYPERGFSPRWAIPRAGIIIVSYLLLCGLKYTQSFAGWISTLPSSMLELAYDPLLLNQVSLVVFVSTLLLNGYLLMRRQSLVDAAMLMMTLAAAVMLAFFAQPLVSALYACSALILLLFTILFNSYSMAFIDELTGLPGRRALENQLASVGKHYTLAMVDVDHFKKFNDTYGHDVGDQVLRMVASQMRQAAKGAQVFRYGGEEFTILFKGKDEAAAWHTAERVREAVAGYPMYIRGDNRPEDADEGKHQRRSDKPESDYVQVCISLGLCQNTDDLADSSAVLKAADEALYKAKQMGRNRTIGRQTGITNE